MKPYLQVAMPNGNVYEISTLLIAADRAASYHANRPEEFPTLDAAMKDTVSFFEDPFEITEWASNNMNWADVAQHARLVAITPDDDMEGHWANGEKSLHDEPVDMSGLLKKSKDLIALPLQMFMTAMAADKNICTCVSLSEKPEDPPSAAIIIAKGPATSLFIMAAHQTTKFIADAEAQSVKNATAH